MKKQWNPAAGMGGEMVLGPQMGAHAWLGMSTWAQRRAAVSSTQCEAIAAMHDALKPMLTF